MGGQSTFTQEIANAICERLATGESLRRICRDDGMPAAPTVCLWVRDDIQGFAEQYARARDIGLDLMADELLDISDDGSNDSYTDEDDVPRTNFDVIQRSRLRVDTRKWYLSKLAPKRYGDKSSVELTGANGGPVQISDTERVAKLKALLALAQSRQDADIADLI